MRQNLQKLQNESPRAPDKDRTTYKKLLNAAPDAVLFVDQQGKILRVNAQLEKRFSLSRKRTATAGASKS